MLERMHAAKQTCDELRSFYNGEITTAASLGRVRIIRLTDTWWPIARASIEEDYARKLLSLCRKSLGSQELGTLKTSLDTLRGEVECMGKQHQNNAAQMRSELEEPLAAFSGGMKERRKIVQNGIEKLLKVKQQQTQHVNKVSHTSASSSQAPGILTLFRRGIDTSRSVSRSRATSPRDTWSWGRRSARTRRSSRRPRSA